MPSTDDLRSDLILRRFFDLSLEPLCIAGLDGRFLRMNPAWVGILGFAIDELEGSPFMDFVHSDDRDATGARISALVNDRRAIDGFECRFVARDGSTRWLRWRATLDMPNGVMLAAATDFTDDRRRDDELEQARRQRDRATRNQTEFFNLSADLLAVSTLDGELLQVNQAWSTSFGYDSADLANANFIDFVHPDDIDATIVGIADMIEGAGVAEFEHRVRRRDGTYRWVTWSGAVDRTMNRIFGVGRDTTERRETEAQLRDAIASAEQANLAKSTFLANMSHELRTPLNSVIGFSNVLRKNKQESLTATEVQYLGRIQSNGEHLLHLINDVLDLSKIEAGGMRLERQEVDLVEIVNDVLLQLDPVTSRAVELRGEGPVDLAATHTDPHRLKQVLINLVGNACKFTEQGSVTVRVVANGRTPIRIDVIDTGPGIAESKLPRLFEPFRQADESTARTHGGTGLGLTIARELSALLGFGLTVKSQVGRGSTFSVHLVPSRSAVSAARPDPAPDASDAVGAHPAPLGDSPQPFAPELAVGVTVLVIDDEADARALIERHLEDLGITVVTSSSSVHGLAIAQRIMPDVIILDLMMPGVDGWVLLGLLRHDPVLVHIPVVICSIVEADHRASLPGAAGFLSKPFDPTDLKALLAEVIQTPEGHALVVDDDPDARALLQSILEENGLRVTHAENGRDALAELRTHGVPDVIFLDLIMPVLDGFGVLAELRADAELRDCPVVVMTAKDLSDSEREDLAVGDVALLSKGDLLAGRLETTLTAMLERRRAQDPTQTSSRAERGAGHR
jgi:PAS domain S-box-containing protein